MMPKLIPPITTVEQALSYKRHLEVLAPDVTFLMSLYLAPFNDTLEAKAAGVRGINSYPAGVTTNSASGVVDHAQLYPVFAAMEEQDLILTYMASRRRVVTSPSSMPKKHFSPPSSTSIGASQNVVSFSSTARPPRRLRRSKAAARTWLKWFLHTICS
jgi:dihydroorotase